MPRTAREPTRSSILFLDVDGVLNDRVFVRTHRTRGTYGMVDRAKVALLNDVVERSGCLVVVSSTWRRDERFRSYLRRRGARVRYHRDWRTRGFGPGSRIDGDDGEGWTRGHEIADWLSRNPVDRYAIVDDGDDMLPGQRGRFVMTTYEAGLQSEHVERLVSLLAPT